MKKSVLSKDQKQIAEQYYLFARENQAKGSGTAHSYVTAINKIDVALHNARLLDKADSVWDIHDNKKLLELYNFINGEKKKPDGGIFRNDPSPSYWKKGFCSAAVKKFVQFLSLQKREDEMVSIYDSLSDADAISAAMGKIKLDVSPLLLEDDDIDITSQEGKTKIREVETRQNQNVFRRIVLKNYSSRCCVTGLDVVEVLQASHISSWKEDKKNRLNPENGLCLSATYDAAFDRYLISLDEDYRLIFAPSLKEHYTNAAFKEQFCKIEGQKIIMPKRFMPSQEFLAKHRECLV